MTEAMAGDYSKKLRALRALCRAGESEDVTVREFLSMGRRAALFYVDGIASSADMDRFLLRPLLDAAAPEAGADLSSHLLSRVLPVAAVKRTDRYGDAVARIFSGDAALILEGMDGALTADVKGFVKRAVSQPVNETVVAGPHAAFTESLRDNLVLLRRMYPSPDLVSEEMTVGTRVPTRLCLLYVPGIAREEVVREVRRRLLACRADYVSSLGMLEQLIEDDPFALMPQAVSTERPDRAVSFLCEGQAVIVMENAPMVLALPAGFLHLFHAPDDTSLRWQYGSFLRLLRLGGMALALLLPGAFLALTVFHPEGMSLSLLTSVVESQARVPMTLFASVLLMLLVFALINEAASRIPGAMGASLSIVSGLILGQAAVEADLISPLVLIVVALSGLGSYTAPAHALTLALRIAQLLLAVAAGIGGYPGMMPVLFFLLLRAAALKSVGFPCFFPAYRGDGLLRLPFSHQRGRGPYASPAAPPRAAGPLRAWRREGP
ncbi:MAG: spore germination protein [Clostridia bacterium]|nr:spore germination protein [Clostridia bacterium]